MSFAFVRSPRNNRWAEIVILVSVVVRWLYQIPSSRFKHLQNYDVLLWLFSYLFLPQVKKPRPYFEIKRIAVQSAINDG